MKKNQIEEGIINQPKKYRKSWIIISCLQNLFEGLPTSHAYKILTMRGIKTLKISRELTVSSKFNDHIKTLCL
jgi:hypothetical protein